MWALCHPRPERRHEAVNHLGAHGDPRAEGPLRRLATDDRTDPDLAVAAMRALVAIGGLDAYTDILSRLARTGPPLLRAAALDLLHSGPPTAAPPTAARPTAPIGPSQRLPVRH